MSFVQLKNDEGEDKDKENRQHNCEAGNIF